MENLTKDNSVCPLKLTMDLIGGKWKLSIICLLSGKSNMRYNEIKRGVPEITNMMLSQSLKDLASFGVVERTQYNEVPVRVEYALTEKGSKLLSILQLLNIWGSEHINTIDNVVSRCDSCVVSSCVER